jgi:uncharacterized membrane protein
MVKFLGTAVLAVALALAVWTEAQARRFCGRRGSGCGQAGGLRSRLASTRPASNCADGACYRPGPAAMPAYRPAVPVKMPEMPAPAAEKK